MNQTIASHDNVAPHPLPGLICLLAGYSLRMGSAKQHLQLGERTFLGHILHTLEQFRDQLQPMLFLVQTTDHQAQQQISDWGGHSLINPNPSCGPLSSIAIGLSHLPHPRQGCLIWPVDHCLVTATTIAALLAAERQHPQAIIIPSTGTRRGHPPLFPAWTHVHLRQASASEGARQVLRQFADAIHHVVVDDPGIISNINTADALAVAQATLLSGLASPTHDQQPPE